MTHYRLEGRRVWVAGHRGMVGSAVVRRLAREGCTIVSAPRETIDLTRQAAVEAFVAATRPQTIVMAAARVGGILANQAQPAAFLYDNLAMAAHVIEAAHRHGVERLLFLGSSCVYPKFAAQPIREEALLSGPLEPTNDAYAVAKIAGLRLVEAYRRQYGRDYIAAMPCNLYGPGDNFDPTTSHVLPALIRKVHEAKRLDLPAITLWGSGTPRREFLHVDDCADALVFLLKNHSGDGHLNLGAGTDLTILALAEMVCEVAGYRGEILLDPSKPDGTPRKLMDSGRLQALGWQPAITLRDGIAGVYAWFADRVAADGSIAHRPDA
ncbi:GDP-L-fucose synthase [Lichenihabitans sp. Uapishka_5]|uniref:GDP-L-fucose synthase family protein n=1 Tax=Lichenihabitans sp. Uapishka_5 TaxID=3037302 RepID=UPI0029E7D7C7|nr:GDP-L-fucose synthase [Lichenihabitans sp. Uapishka_5]MDX7953673.1 GDP-L-fucose synthase [Lichenihabitans sp. Uapishka_5]